MDVDSRINITAVFTSFFTESRLAISTDKAFHNDNTYPILQN